MPQKCFYVDTGTVDSGSRALAGAADAFDRAVGTFQAGAARPDAGSAFGELSAMTEAGRHYLEMATATVTTLREAHGALGHDASRLSATGLMYEQADDAVAAFSGVGGVSGGPRIVAVNFADLRDARDDAARLARNFAHEIASIAVLDARLSKDWKGAAASAFQDRIAQCQRQACAALTDIVAYHRFLEGALDVYEASEQDAAEHWPIIPDPAPLPAPDDHAESVPVVGWEAAGTDIARAVLFIFGLPWPGGVPVELRDLASCWRAMADAADEMLEGLNASASTVAGAWRGRAAVAFGEHVRAQHAHLAQAPARLRAVAFALEQYAAEVEQIVGTIVVIAAEIAVMVFAGQLLGFATGFVSDLITSGAVAARVARITACLTRLTESAGRLAHLLRSTIHTIELLRAILATLAEEARVELSMSRVGEAARSLDAIATRIGGAEYRTVATEMAREWRIDFAATAAQQLIVNGHLDPGNVILNATVSAVGRGGQTRWEGVSALLRSWRQNRPLVYAGVSGAIMNDLNGAVVDPLSGKDAGETALDLAVRPAYSGPRGVLNNHATLGPRRRGVPPSQTSVEQTTLKVADKVSRALTETQIEATHGYASEPDSAIPAVPD